MNKKPWRIFNLFLIASFILIIYVVFAKADGRFNHAYEQGYQDGRCPDLAVGCTQEIAPIAPLHSTSDHEWNDGLEAGYIRGAQDRLDEEQRRRQAQQAIDDVYGVRTQEPPMSPEVREEMNRVIQNMFNRNAQ